MALVPLILFVLFVFAITLMVVGMGRYAAFLIQLRGKNHTQISNITGLLKYITCTNIGGKLSLFKVFLISLFVSFLIIIGIAVIQLVNG